MSLLFISLINDLDFRPANSCNSDGMATNTPATTEKKIKLVVSEAPKKSKSLQEKKITELASTLSPSINLNKVSWMNSNLTERYDPRLSIKVRRAELSGFEAMLLVSIPL